MASLKVERVDKLLLVLPPHVGSCAACPGRVGDVQELEYLLVGGDQVLPRVAAKVCVVCVHQCLVCVRGSVRLPWTEHVSQEGDVQPRVCQLVRRAVHPPGTGTELLGLYCSLLDG